jgi:peptide/nickel transport system substrate-binding protein
MKRYLYAVALAAAALSATQAVAAGLRIGIQEDLDQIDPAMGVAFVDRIVFTALCDKLVDVGPDLNYVPQLATEWSWSADTLALTMKLRPGVVFHDGEKLDAQAVKFNIDRYKTLPDSRRKAELGPVSSIDVVDPMTVRFNLSQPYAPLLGVLTDRAGMMVSPKAAQELGPKFGSAPVCSGPYRFVERVQQGRIVLRKFEQYYDAAAFPADGVTYTPMPDPTVRLANLLSGELDLIERVNPTDLPQVRADRRVKLYESPSVAYQSLIINTNNSARADTPLGKNPKLREAFELAIDREALNQVVFNGEYIPSNQQLAPGSTYHAKQFPVPKRDIARAKQLVAEAGFTRVPVTFYVATNPVLQQVAQVVQAMTRDAGFDVKLEVGEAVTIVQRNQRGDFEMSINIWSGRPDPDGNIAIWVACDGSVNFGKYCNPALDDLLRQAKATTVTQERQGLYDKVIATLQADRPMLVLYHLKWHWAASAKVKGFTTYPDGLIRLRGVSVD